MLEQSEYLYTRYIRISRDVEYIGKRRDDTTYHHMGKSTHIFFEKVIRVFDRPSNGQIMSITKDNPPRLENKHPPLNPLGIKYFFGHILP